MDLRDGYQGQLQVGQYPRRRNKLEKEKEMDLGTISKKKINEEGKIYGNDTVDYGRGAGINRCHGTEGFRRSGKKIKEAVE